MQSFLMSSSPSRRRPRNRRHKEILPHIAAQSKPERGLGSKRQIVVLNDEAHHCYLHRTISEDEALKGEERREAERRDREARVWVTGLQAVARKIGVKVIYDLSATLWGALTRFRPRDP
jgi:hypothetical protein